MRLELRRKLHPYSTLLELADALDVTLPHLKRRLRELESRGELTLESLATSVGAKRLPVKGDDLFLAFHRRNLCMVCGSALEKVKGRQAGWGEFLQCPFCLFSLHENADFNRLREIASDKLNDLDIAFKEAKRVFDQRTQRGRALKSGSMADLPKQPWNPH